MQTPRGERLTKEQAFFRLLYTIRDCGEGHFSKADLFAIKRSNPKFFARMLRASQLSSGGFSDHPEFQWLCDEAKDLVDDYGHRNYYSNAASSSNNVAFVDTDGLKRKYLRAKAKSDAQHRQHVFDSVGGHRGVDAFY